MDHLTPWFPESRTQILTTIGTLGLRKTSRKPTTYNIEHAEVVKRLREPRLAEQQQDIHKSFDRSAKGRKMTEPGTKVDNAAAEAAARADRAVAVINGEGVTGLCLPIFPPSFSRDCSLNKYMRRIHPKDGPSLANILVCYRGSQF